MNDDDFLLDEEDDLEDDYLTPIEEEDEEDDGESEDNLEEETSESKKLDTSDRSGNLTEDDVRLSSYYDDIMASVRNTSAEKVSLEGKRFDACIIDAVRIILGASPKNTSAVMIENYMGECFNTQGHNRIPASKYTPDQPLRSGDVDEEFGGTGDDGFNAEYAKEARDHISRFIYYLANQDLSKDSIVSKKHKQRLLPAFLIFLFSSGMYDLILNCKTLPPVYETQVANAFKEIQQQKYKIVEALAERYESRGRDKVAERVRKMGLSWFDREPATLRGLRSYDDLELTQEDIMDYREFRPKFNNASKSVTQELISDYIKVVIKPGKLYEKLKDKTRSDAISDVKEVYKNWSKENPMDSELADSIIWKK